MKRKLKYILFMAIFLIAITGCTRTKSYTYEVDTGEKVKVSVITSDKYDITKEVPFKISKDDKVLTTGEFYHSDYFETYKEAVEKEPKAALIEEESKDEYEYIMYSYNDNEYDIVIRYKDSKTGIKLVNRVSPESAKEVFENIKIEIKK